MGTTRTADEAKQNYIAVMGEPLGSLFHALWQEVAWLHRKWDEYVELFGTKASRVDLLNRTAPTFFRTIQDVLWEGPFSISPVSRILQVPLGDTISQSGACTLS